LGFICNNRYTFMRTLSFTRFRKFGKCIFSFRYYSFYYSIFIFIVCSLWFYFLTNEKFKLISYFCNNFEQYFIFSFTYSSSSYYWWFNNYLKNKIIFSLFFKIQLSNRKLRFCCIIMDNINYRSLGCKMYFSNKSYRKRNISKIN